MINQLRSTAQLARAGAWSDIWSVTRSYWRSESETVGLRRDMAVPFVNPQAALPIAIRPLRGSDVPALFEAGGQPLCGEALRERSIRMRMMKAGIATCYVAANEEDSPCYVQWLIGSDENHKLRDVFGDRFPCLAPDEMLLEGAFTLERWRGNGIMAAAMSRIAEKAVERNAGAVITFVGAGNIPSLKGCKKAGFEPFVSRTDHWRHFQRSSHFGHLSGAESPPA